MDEENLKIIKKLEIGGSFMKRIIIKRFISVVLLCVILITVCGCGKTDNQAYPDASLGVLYSTDSGSRSLIEWYDSELNSLGTASYSFSGASVSQTNAHIQDNTIFLAPTGEGQKKDYGKIALIDPTKGSFEEIDTNRINQYDCTVEESYLALTSNLNGECFVDLIDISNRDIRSLDISDNSVICTQPILINGEVYASATDGDKNYICKCDFTGNRVNIITELPDELSTYLEKHGNDLVWITQGKLVKYNTATKKSESINLSSPDALNLNIVGDVVWIAYTDQFDENYYSVIEARNYRTGEVICIEKFEGAVLQLEADDSHLFVRTYDELIEYSYTNEKLTEQNRLRCEKNGYYYGGFFYLKGK